MDEDVFKIYDDLNKNSKEELFKMAETLRHIIEFQFSMLDRPDWKKKMDNYQNYEELDEFFWEVWNSFAHIGTEKLDAEAAQAELEEWD
jgi:hypothetical protein